MDLLIPAIDVHQAKLGRVPRLVAADAGFYSARNEAAAKAKGVKRVCNPNRSSKSAARKREQKKRWFRSGQRQPVVGRKERAERNLQPARSMAIGRVAWARSPLVRDASWWAASRRCRCDGESQAVPPADELMLSRHGCQPRNCGRLGSHVYRTNRRLRRNDASGLLPIEIAKPQF